MWFLSKLPKHIPQPTGPFVPGCADVLLDYSINGLFMRFYYPTDKLNKPDEIDHTKWCTCIPDDGYIQGFSNVLQIPAFLIKTLIWKFGTYYTPVNFGAKVKADKKLKCILLSHGLGAYRSFYNCVCTELASRGYLVVVLEHRDASSCYTYYYKSKEEANLNKRTIVPFLKINFGKDHYEKRNKQLHERAKECERALEFLLDLNNGTVPHNVMNDVLNNNQADFKLEDLVGKIDVDTLTMAGQSYGGATALLTLSRRKEFKQGVLLDPWMFPIKGENAIENVNQPLLFVNTQTFHITSNVNAMEKFVTEKKQSMFTIMRSTHETQTDSVFLVGYWLNWMMKKIDPNVGIKINNYLILEFLQKHSNHETDISDCLQYLKEEAKNYSSGLTKPWA